MTVLPGLHWCQTQTGREEQVTLEAERPGRKSSRGDKGNIENGKEDG